MKSLLIILSIQFVFILGCRDSAKQVFDSGVSLQLAQDRYNDISKVKYQLEMEIPDSLNQPVQAKSLIILNKEKETPLVFDFAAQPNQVHMVKANDQKVFFSIENEHLIIPFSYLQKGKNSIEIDFEMGEGALNRNPDYLYSLFVPDRARTAIPCFDQPDIKASVSYGIKMPKSWTAITNGKAFITEDVGDKYQHVSYSASKPISTYLWAFAAGRFNKIVKTKDDFEVSLFHLESDIDKLKMNESSIFEMVFHSIDWLKEYTQVDFPFQKYDLVCIPSFQFSGMEHPGAIYYRAEQLFLSENPTQKEILHRSQLIAHETAHMWFGDLVTMKWFSGVWQKEVFANFIADKIVKEQFPELNHDLTFLMNHFPSSFSVDRTVAANPIQQKLENLKDAGSMYGDIIYHKAPIVMNQLEYLLGEKTLQNGLSKYLKQYSYGNATWDDLISILNSLSEYNIELWSKNWVYTPGRPIVEFVFEDDALMIKQKPEHGDSSKIWAQRINYLLVKDTSEVRETAEILSAKEEIGESKPDFILPSVDALGYGLFLFDPVSVEYVLNNIFYWDDELQKGATLIHLYENFLQGNISPDKYLKMLQTLIKSESNEQILTLACRQLKTIIWRFTSSDFRLTHIESTENLLQDKIKESNSPGINKMLLNTWAEIVLTPKGLRKLKQLVIRGKQWGRVKLSDRDLSSFAFLLAMKDNDLDDAFISDIAESMSDEEVKNMMLFVSPVFSQDNTGFESFIEGLEDVNNRNKENWILTALKYVHHPYYQESRMKYMDAALWLIQPIKETGSLFFPARWIDTLLRGYGSTEALSVVDYFLKDNPQFPEDLRNKLMQSLDMVERSRMVREKYLQN